jgi:hypothetical protein
VLGLDGLRRLNITLALTCSSFPLSTEIEKLIYQCSQCSGGMKTEPISLETSGEPVFFKARPMAYGLMEPVKKTLDGMVTDGIIEPVDSSVWGTPIVIAMKSNGQPRICGDYKVTLNPVLKKTACTTGDVEDMFTCLNGSSLFSKIDLSNAFLQVPLEEKSRECTTINTKWGLFRFKFLPFGLTVSPGIFQRVIDKLIHGLSGVRAYQDDLLVFGSSSEEHDSRLKALLMRLYQHNVKINSTKSVFKVPRIKYLGYYVDGHGISPDKDRIIAVSQASKPTTAAQLQSFLGFIQYYSKFIPQFSTTALPLFELLSQSTFKWSSNHEQAYNALVKMVTSDCTLKTFNPRLESQLTVDASEFGVGAVLEQQGHPVIYISQTSIQI